MLTPGPKRSYQSYPFGRQSSKSAAAKSCRHPCASFGTAAVKVSQWLHICRHSLYSPLCGLLDKEATDAMLQFINRLLGRNQNTLPPFNFARNRFRVKKKWPPNLRELTEKQQFRFERKFKRRTKLKSLRPRWDRWTKIVQWSMIGFILVYGVLFHDFRKDPMNPRRGEQPFEGLRQRMWELLGNFYTHTESTLKVERGARKLEPLGTRATEDAEDDQSPSARS